MEFKKVLLDKVKDLIYDESLVIHKVEYLKKNCKLRLYLSSNNKLDLSKKKIISEAVDEILGTKVQKDISCVVKEEDFNSCDHVINLINQVFESEPIARRFFAQSTIDLKEDKISIVHYNELLTTHIIRKNVKELLEEYIDVLYNKKFNINISFDVSLTPEDLEISKPDFEKIITIKKEDHGNLNKSNENNGQGDKNSSIAPVLNEKSNSSFNKANTFNKNGKKLIDGSKKEVKSDDPNQILGKPIKDTPIPIKDVNEGMKYVTIAGEVFKVEDKELRTGKVLKSIYVFDGEDSMIVKSFLNSSEEAKGLKEGMFCKLKGSASIDRFSGELTIMVNHIVKLEDKKVRSDDSDIKRVELHAHTIMSTMDGLTNPKDLVKRAIKWGHKAIAITDHAVVQSFPDAMNAGRSEKEEFIKVLYGVEAYVVNDKEPIVTGDKKYTYKDDFVVFDIETTGFSNNNDKIIEIGAVKVSEGIVVDRFSAFVDPERPLPNVIIELTKITDSMLKGQDKIEEVLPRFLDFCKDSLLVAHNANFDMGFIRRNADNLGLEFNFEQMDTVLLARYLFPNLKRHRLDTIAKHLGINMGSHHRAVDDAETTARILLRSFELLHEQGIEDTNELNKSFISNIDVSKGMPSHAIILAKNQRGLKKLYQLVSESHLKYFFRTPRLPKSIIEVSREDLLIGSSCSSSELFKAILDNRRKEVIEEIVRFYDYLEVQPIRNYQYLIDEGRCTKEELEDIVRYIISLGKKFNKKVVATGDVHMMEFEDEPFRRIIKYNSGFGGEGTSVAMPFLTTKEMLDEFKFLDLETAKEIVVENTNYIADLIESIIPIPYDTFPPKMPGAEEEIRDMTLNNAYAKYGNPLPEVVQKRVDRELKSIIGHGYAVLYLVAHKLVKKSLDDGYLVGSRGSVGSSLVATFTDITEVNGLPPHYVCPNCKHSEFFLDNSVSSGVDLEEKACPKCGTMYDREGHNIPFETFLGFEGDKEPDIDLNFSGEYQPVVHKYCEVLFGEGFVFRAGTIGTVADKTAMGYVRKYFEDKGKTINRAELERLSKGCTGIKRTSGQHPGGIMVVPSDNDIHNFCPIQHPADDQTTDVITTHFDYHSISGRLLKLDILGHDDPTVLRMLQDITGLDPQTIPLNDEKVLSLFTGTEALGITEEELGCPVGTYGIPEFGTKFVRQMLIDTKPKKFSDLVIISGLSHGTDVWLNNAQEFIKNGDTDLSGCISLRDNIMIYLIHYGLPPKDAFFIMEHVRKGKGLKPEEEAQMRQFNVPEWYIESCKRIKYMFPKGHAVAYVTMAIRIAYYKVYYPLHYYATYFSVRAIDFDAELVLKGEGAVKSRMDEIIEMGNDASVKDAGMLNVFELVYEMFKRGFNFKPVDIYKSDATKFLVDGNSLIPPLNSVTGVADNAAKQIAEARSNGTFISKEDFKQKTKVGRVVMEALDKVGCFEGMGETNQISFF